MEKCYNKMAVKSIVLSKMNRSNVGEEKNLYNFYNIITMQV